MRYSMLLLGIAISACAVLGKPSAAIYEAVLGDLPPPRKLTPFELQISSDLLRKGVIAQIPDSVPLPRPAKLNKLTPIQVQSLVQEIGSPLEALPGASGIVKSRSPAYPPELAKSREDARVVCYFEVLPDGSVGRIFGGQVSAKLFLIECAQKLKDWRFAESDKTRFMRLPFEASYARNGPR